MTSDTSDRLHDLDAVGALPPPAARSALARRDLARGLVRYRMWWALAVQDIRLRYRGSMLGPFWLTISTAIMVLGMGVIYAHLFHTRTQTYVPYLTLGLIIWNAIGGLILDSCQTFLAAGSVIQQVPIAFSIHVYRVVCRNFIILAHSLVIVPIVLVIFSVPLGASLVELVPAILALAINGVWVALLFGMFCARFRDIPPIVNSLLQVGFFLTPVIWPIDALGIYRPLAEFNPLFAAIDVVRAPLLGVAPVPTSWPVLLVATAIGSGFTFAVFARFRSRIAYWV
jgi:ABC-2 type transport system permease protein/lipopolysaccharide transport system permease protein